MYSAGESVPPPEVLPTLTLILLANTGNSASPEPVVLNKYSGIWNGRISARACWKVGFRLGMVGSSG